MCNLENNPFEMYLLQKLKDNINIRDIGVHSRFIEGQRFNMFNSGIGLKIYGNYMMSIIPANGILRSDENIIMIFDLDDKNLVADTRLKNLNSRELGTFVYNVARKYFKNIKILIPRTGNGLILLDILLKTEIKDTIIYTEKNNKIIDCINSKIQNEKNKNIRSYGIEDNLVTYHENCALLKTLIESEPGTGYFNKASYLYSPFIVEDILSLEVRKAGDYELTLYLTTFLNGMRYMNNIGVNTTNRCTEGIGDE